MKRNRWIRNVWVFGMLMACVGSVAAQQVEFNYNGRVRVGGQPFSGEGRFKFSLLTQDGEYTYWANDGVTLDGTEPTSVVTAQCTEGFFSVDIGDTSTTGMAALDASLFNITDHVFLRTWFSDGVHGFEVLQPDRRVVNPALLAQESYDDVTIYVDGLAGDDRHSGLRPDKAKKTINGGVKLVPRRVSSNVTVRIAPGVYREQVNLYGITTHPEKMLRIIGDETWTTNSLSDPSVVVTGTDDDATSTPVRPMGFMIQDCSRVEIIGIMASYCATAGFRVVQSNTIELRSCKAFKAGSGFHISMQSSATFYDCVALNNVAGFAVEMQCSVWLYNCRGRNNSSYGLATDSSFVFPYYSEMTHNTWYGITAAASRMNFKGTGNYSNNGYAGIDAFLHSSLFFSGTEYAGHLDNNGVCGLRLRGQSISFNQGGNTFVGNTPIVIETGSGAY